MKITKTQLKQIIREELTRALNENAEGYYVKSGSYGAPGFYDPAGNEMPGLDGVGDLTGAELLMATENLPEFANFINKKRLDAFKQRAQEVGRRKGLGLYPDHDYMTRFWATGQEEAWEDLFQLYLQKVLNIPDAQVVEPPQEEDDYGDDEWGF